MEMNGKLLRVLSHTLKRYHFTVWLMCSVVLSFEAECPYTCTCFNISVICKDYEEITLPFEVPNGTTKLTLNNKNMSVLIRGAFTPNGTDLQELSLQDNNIKVIESGAFCGLLRLHTLDLSGNRLETVSSGAFLDLESLLNLYLSNTLTTYGARALPSALWAGSLRKLNKLDLSGNFLKSIPLLGFGNHSLNELILTNNSITTLNGRNLTQLKKHNEIRVFLKDNPFNCTCDKTEFYDWLQNVSQCEDAKDLKCSEPKGKVGNNVLDSCKKKPHDLRSFVLLGIVLALIGVVFLMVLYLNRRGIKRWLNNIREACRDQMEVYHYRYEQDSDPRLANVAV